MRTKREILEYIKECYQLKNDAALASFLGIAATTLSSWKSRESIDYDLIFAKCVDLDFNTLINGKKTDGQNEQAKRTGNLDILDGQTDGQLKNDFQKQKDNELLITSPSTPLKEIAVEHIPVNMVKGREAAYKPIPFVSESAVAGFGNADFAIKEKDVKDYYVIPKFKDSNIDFMIEIHGESMYPTFKSGDVVACTIIRESTFIQWNRVHLIATAEQGILIKRLKKGITGTTIMLVSDNLDYDPFEVELTSVRGIALVQGLVRLE